MKKLGEIAFDTYAIPKVDDDVFHKFAPFIEFIHNYLELREQEGENCFNDPDRNTLTLSVVQLAKYFLSFGFFDMQGQLQLSLRLITILKRTCAFGADSQTAHILNPKTAAVNAEDLAAQQGTSRRGLKSKSAKPTPTQNRWQ